jgi:hypothetical protein
VALPQDRSAKKTPSHAKQKESRDGDPQALDRRSSFGSSAETRPKEGGLHNPAKHAAVPQPQLTGSGPTEVAKVESAAASLVKF